MDFAYWASHTVRTRKLFAHFESILVVTYFKLSLQTFILLSIVYGSSIILHLDVKDTDCCSPSKGNSQDLRCWYLDATVFALIKMRREKKMYLHKFVNRLFWLGFGVYICRSIVINWSESLYSTSIRRFYFWLAGEKCLIRILKWTTTFWRPFWICQSADLWRSEHYSMACSRSQLLAGNSERDPITLVAFK